MQRPWAEEHRVRQVTRRLTALRDTVEEAPCDGDPHTYHNQDMDYALLQLRRDVEGHFMDQNDPYDGRRPIVSRYLVSMSWYSVWHNFVRGKHRIANTPTCYSRYAL